MYVQCDKKQIQELVRRERKYRRLLEKCLYALNMIPNSPIPGLEKDSYQLASEIEEFLARLDRS